MGFWESFSSGQMLQAISYLDSVAKLVQAIDEYKRSGDESDLAGDLLDILLDVADSRVGVAIDHDKLRQAVEGLVEVFEPRQGQQLKLPLGDGPGESVVE